jgi:hypothetical protein
VNTNWFSLCKRCGKALACFSIEWSNLPDDKKCRCAVPVPPDSPLSVILKKLFGI